MTDINESEDPLLQELRNVKESLVKEQEERKTALAEAEKDRKEERATDRFKMLLVILGIFLALCGVTWLGITAHDAASKANRVLHQHEIQRVETRLTVCNSHNEQTERVVNVTRALLAATPPSEEDTSEDLAQRDKALKIFLDEQEFAIRDGIVLAPFLNCSEFSTDPAKAYENPILRENP